MSRGKEKRKREKCRLDSEKKKKGMRRKKGGRTERKEEIKCKKNL